MLMGFPRYPDSERLDQPLPEEGRAVASPLGLTVFFLVNLGAAYAPAIFSFPFLLGVGNGILLVFFSPVLLGANDPLVAWLVLSLYLAAVSILSAVFYQSRIARFVVPGCLFAASMVQQVIFMNLI